MSLRWFIIHMSIRRKVTLLLLVPCGVVMLLAVTVLFAFQIRMFSEGHHREMSAVADVVSANSTAAVAFNDGASATQILSSLHAISHITGAAVFLPDGTPFATFGQPVGAPIIEVEERYFRQGNDAFMIHPLTLEGKQIGALNIRSNYQAAHAGMVRLMAGMLATILVIGSVVGALLSNWLQKLVSKPILRLTGTAQAVADNNDYSVRASVEPSGELGILTRTFNKMITRIQSQEIALLASQRKLEAILNSIGGVVWEADAATWTVNFVSRPFESMFGYRVDDWLKDRDFWMNIIFSGDRTRVLEVSRQAIAQKKSFLIEYRVRANDGRLVWVRESVSVEVADDRSACLRGLIVDVTEQKAAAENLERRPVVIWRSTVPSRSTNVRSSAWSTRSPPTWNLGSPTCPSPGLRFPFFTSVVTEPALPCGRRNSSVARANNPTAAPRLGKSSWVRSSPSMFPMTKATPSGITTRPATWPAMPRRPSSPYFCVPRRADAESVLLPKSSSSVMVPHGPRKLVTTASPDVPASSTSTMCVNASTNWPMPWTRPSPSSG
jgi:PAS domain S-box-containing protein